MASRSQTWFDDEKLFSGERRVRTGRVRIQTDDPPHWWEGTLILTTDRLFFLSDVENPLLGQSAFWLADVRTVTQPAPNRVHIDGNGRSASFHILGRRLNLPGQRTRTWLESINAVLPYARPAAAFQPSTHRAAG